MSIIAVLHSWLQLIIFGFLGSVAPADVKPNDEPKRSDPIDIWEAIDIAPFAIERLAGITAGLSTSLIAGKRAHNDLFRALASELLIFASSLGEQQEELLGLDYESLTVQRIQRLLLDLEQIFSVRAKPKISCVIY